MKLWRWLAVVAWMAAIFAVSSMSSESLPGGYPGLGHFIEYSVLGVLLASALLPEATPLRTITIAILVAAAYGASDEFHQSFVPGRTPDILDWIVDVVSATLGATALTAVTVRRSRTAARS